MSQLGHLVHVAHRLLVQLLLEGGQGAEGGGLGAPQLVHHHQGPVLILEVPGLDEVDDIEHLVQRPGVVRPEVAVDNPHF